MYESDRAIKTIPYALVHSGSYMASGGELEGSDTVSSFPEPESEVDSTGSEPESSEDSFPWVSVFSVSTML